MQNWEGRGRVAGWEEREQTARWEEPERVAHREEPEQTEDGIRRERLIDQERFQRLWDVIFAVTVTASLVALLAAAMANPSAGEALVLEEAQVGDTVTFGAYEQDGDEGNGPEPLSWRVLAREGDRLLLMTSEGIECVTCYSGWGESWADSALRSWLAQEFPQKAFTEDEQVRLVPEESVAAADSDASLATLLTLGQVEQYLPDASMRSCTVTKAALAERTFAAGEDGTMGWWLRPPEDAGYFAASVRRDGSILTYGGDMGRDVLCVRLAIWVRP